MLLIAVVLVSVLTVPLAGGRLSALSEVRLRYWGLIVAALAVQILIITVMPGGAVVQHRVAHLATYAAAALFVIVNRRTPGVLLVGAGGALNALAISLNGGVMPASATALAAAGLPVTDPKFMNSAVVAHAKLPFIGDVLSTPPWLPLHNVFSVGDVL